MALKNSTNLNGIISPPVYSTTLLILIQVISRAITFTSNQIVLRHLSPNILGATSQLELYSVTVLFFSREFLRTTTQREPPDNPTMNATVCDKTSENESQSTPRTYTNYDPLAAQTVINLSYISLCLGLPLATLLALCYFHLITEEISRIAFFHSSVTLVGISCIVELATEPFFAVVQQRMLYRTRAIVETIAAVSKGLTVCGILSWAACTGWDAGLIPFALSYLSYSLALICGYMWEMLAKSSDENFSFLLTPIHSRNRSEYLANRFARRLTWLGAHVYLQLIVKYLLTQGDSMILAALSSLEDQGIYSLASNYGGLVARIVLQPVEESSRNLYARLLNSMDPEIHNLRGVSAAKSHLVTIIRAYGIFAVLAFVIGPNIAPLILYTLIGSRWMSPKVLDLLSAYCYYIPFLAFNGITEAFVSAAVDAPGMRRQAAWMGFFSACFAAISFLLLQIGKWGALGLVWANIINMGIRTVWSYHFIKGYLRQHKDDLTIYEISLERQTYGIFLASLSVTSTIRHHSSTTIYGTLITLGVGLAYTLLILYSEKRYLTKQYNDIFSMVASRKERNLHKIATFQ